MKPLLTILLMLGSYCIASIDSLLAVYQTLPDNEYKAEIAYKIGNQYNENRIYDSALNYLKNSLQYCVSDTLKADIHKKIGNIFVDSTNYKQALIHLSIADSLYLIQKNHIEQSEVLNLKGMCYGLTNNLEKAIEMFQLCHKNAVKRTDSADIGLAYFNIGLAHYFKGEYKKATENYINSLKIREILHDTAVWVNSLISVGEVFRIRNDLDNSIKYYTKALTLKKGIKAYSILSYLYSELALVSKLKHDYSKALIFIDTALIYSEKAGYKRGIATLQSYKAGIYKSQNKHSQAFHLYNEALNQYTEIGFEIGIIQAKTNLSELLIKDSDTKIALKHLLNVKPMAISNNLLEEQVEIERLLYLLYKERNIHIKALNHHEQYLILKDSLFNVQKEKQIKTIETEYEVEHKEQQINLLDKENKIQLQQLNKRNILLFSVFALLVLIVLLFVLLIRQNRLKAKLQIEQNQQKLLRSQMNPHFIYNALGAIQNFIFQHNPMDSATYISEFSALMRLVLEGSRNEFVKLSDDIKLVTAFLKLQQLRFNHSFSYEIEVDNRLNTDFVKLPPMLSQPVIENAVEHGMRNLENGEGKIIVSYNIENEMLVIHIFDNGKGICKTNKNVNHKSLATQITKERIDNIRRIHALNIYMNLHSDKNGTEITFKIDTKL